MVIVMSKGSVTRSRILSFLNSNPSASRMQIAEALSISYQSVQKHLKILESVGSISPGFLLYPKSTESGYKFWIMIKTSPVKHSGKDTIGTDYQRELCDEIANEFYMNSDLTLGLEFGSVDVVLGSDFDIILLVFSNHPDAVEKFITKFIRNKRSVYSTSTAWAVSKASK